MCVGRVMLYCSARMQLPFGIVMRVILAHTYLHTRIDLHVCARIVGVDLCMVFECDVSMLCVQ